MADVTAIIPTWNRRALLERTLAALRVQTHPLTETVVVDNGSDDGSADAAGQAGARVIRMTRNAGFAKAVNRGIETARTEWVAILNNDVVLKPEWLERLLRAAEPAGAWFATGKLLRAGNPAILDGTFDLIARSGCAWRCGAGSPESVLDKLIVIDMVPLTAALVRRDLFDRLGPLDEQFESYLEDVDFGLRCAAGGYRGVYVPDAVGFHEGSGTLGTWNRDTVRRLARNQIWLVGKHFRAGGWWPVVAGQLLWGALAIRHGAGSAWCQGKWQGLRRFREIRRRAAGPAPLEFIRRSEDKIWALQKRTGFDLYWRTYFLVAPRGRPRESPEGVTKNT
ncbi:MAG: glycosyltransferase family 2 protein [Bryobacteraceae bacterium]